jgi:hypothetical protein
MEGSALALMFRSILSCGVFNDNCFNILEVLL